MPKIQDILKDEKIGEEVELKGWVYRERDSKNIAFIVLRDSTGTIQAVFKKDENPGAFQNALDATLESAVKIKGTLKEDERSPVGYEIEGQNLEIVHKAERFPITEDQSTEFLNDVRHLWIRSKDITNMMKVRHTILDAARQYFDITGAYEVHPPIFTPNACEGGTELFEVEYFDEEAYLSQSVQLYLEALIYSLENVYSLTPSFRAEKSRTRRHLTEYWHLEWEGAWQNHEDNMEMQEELIEFIVDKVVEKNPEELEALGRDPETLKQVEVPFPRMTYTEAVEKLQDEGFDIEWGEDLGTKEERHLTEDRKVPLIITEYPMEVKTFYMKPKPDNPDVVLNNDMIAPEGFGEVIGGSERETDVEALEERIKEQGIPLEDYEWYLDLRRYGSIPHSGFGLGVERLVRWICNQDHIRDTIPFPRTLNRYSP